MATSKVKVEPMEVENIAEKLTDSSSKLEESSTKNVKPVTKPISINELNVANEIYMMAKTNGDAVGAAKCFSNIFSQLYCVEDPNTLKPTPNELSSVMNQMKEEIRMLLNELKTHHLKLKSLPTPASLGSRQSTSVNPSPVLSPRMRLSSEDRIASKESLSKLDSQLHKSTKGIYYQHLFDNLPEDIKKSILDHSIENCYNPFERYRLTMLTLSIFKDKATTYGSRLLKTLIELSDPTDKTDQVKQANPKSSIMCRYAKSLLVLDAIPLVLNLTPSSSLDTDVTVLFQKALNFYSEQCLKSAASEQEIGELHDGVKKSIAARIVGIEHGLSEDATEEHLLFTLNLLSQKLLETITDGKSGSELEEIRATLTDRVSIRMKYEIRILIHLRRLELPDDIPDDILFGLSKEDTEARPTATPPPKSRGRPKKHAATTNIDDGLRKQLQVKAREAQYVFFLIVQHLFFHCASYLRGSRSRILLNFRNAVADEVTSEMARIIRQRSSRSKSNSQQHNASNPNASKKPKLESQPELSDAAKTIAAISPLNSVESKKLDECVLDDLGEAKECLELLTSPEFASIKKLWDRFIKCHDLTNTDWFRRISIDILIMTCRYEEAVGIIMQPTPVEDAKSELKSEQLVNSIGSHTITTARLRGLVQAVSCHALNGDKADFLSIIDELITEMKQSSLMTNDESITSENIIDEYMVIVKRDMYDDSLGFLFFDLMSIFRYIVDVLLDVTQRYIIHNSATAPDTTIGHTIVLSQFNWPKEGQIYHHCIDWIRAHKPKSATPQSISATTKFTYNDFLQYIRNPNIIEDFMALLSQGYTLDIKGNRDGTSPPSQSTRSGNSSQTTLRGATGGSTTRSGKAITTRGVNKSFKEDLKLALVAQMRNSSSFMPVDLISDFIQTILIPYLS